MLKREDLIEILCKETEGIAFEKRLEKVFPNRFSSVKDYWNTVITESVADQINDLMDYTFKFAVSSESDLSYLFSDLLTNLEEFGKDFKPLEDFPVIGNCKTVLLGSECKKGFMAGNKSFEHRIEFFLTEFGEIISINAYVYRDKDEDEERDNLTYIFRYETGFNGKCNITNYIKCNYIEQYFDEDLIGVFTSDSIDYVCGDIIDTLDGFNIE